MENQFFSELKDKVCVITGGAGVIGSSIARGLAKAGMKTVILDIDEALAGFVSKGAKVLAHNPGRMAYFTNGGPDGVIFELLRKKKKKKPEILCPRKINRQS